MGGSPTLQVITLLSLVVMGIVEGELAFLICPMTTLSNGYMTWPLVVAPVSHHPAHICQLLV